MKISLNWLRDYVDLPQNLEPQELADRLSLSVVEVEGFEREADRYARIVVGKILKIRTHPNADRLHICIVDIGEQETRNKKQGTIEIVCGGKNLKEGMLVAVALPGAKVRWHGEGELVELKEAEVRGVKSYGMICAGEEVGLKDLQTIQLKLGEGPQILDISFTRAKPGVSLAQALGKDDVVFEISNVSLSNRPDLWSHYGIARELAVMYHSSLREPISNFQFPISKPIQKFNDQKIKLIVRVEDKRLCPRYIGALVENVHIDETPEWIVKRLEAVGQRPINPLVDISNYVMFEMGQPVHIFDSQKVRKSESQKAEIIVRRAKKGEMMKTLDGVERKLDEEMLVVADTEKPIAIAGVMGGEGSGVSENTTSIIIECATFNPISVRKTSSRLGLKTDASQRFEKSLDPHLPPMATTRVLQLLQECAVQGKIPEVRSVADVSAKIAAPKFIRLPLEMLDRRVGMAVPRVQAKKILLGLGFRVHPVRNKSPRAAAVPHAERISNGVKGTTMEWRVTPPSWRATGDISIPEDLIEEIGRHCDYNTIPDTLPAFSIAPPPVNSHQLLERVMKRFLTGAGFCEVEHKPFLNPKEWERFGLEKDSHVEVVNPIDPQARFLRQSLLPGLLGDVRTNKNASDTLKFFEWGRIFSPREGEFAVKKGSKEHLPHQPITLSIVISKEVGQEEMLRQIQGIALSALQAAGFKGEVKISINPQHPAYQAGTAFYLSANGAQVGGGAVASILLNTELGMSGKQNIGTVSIDIGALAGVAASVQKFTPLPEYPAIQRDLAIVVKENITFKEIEETIRGTLGALLVSLELFDIFRGRGVPEGMKSLAFHLTFRSAERTLTNKEADEEMQKIILQLQKNHAARVRE